MKVVHVRVFIGLVLLHIVVLPNTLNGQTQMRREEPIFVGNVSGLLGQGAQAPQATEGRIYVGGILGGLIGLGVGIVGGIAVERAGSGTCSDFCGLAGAIVGGALGESLGVALGSHFSNSRRGPVFVSSVVSLGVAVAGAYLASRIDEGRYRTPVFLAIPISQLLAVTALEYHAQAVK